MPDEVQELRKGMSDAAHAIRQPRKRGRFPASGLHKMRQVHRRLPDKDNGNDGTAESAGMTETHKKNEGVSKLE